MKYMTKNVNSFECFDCIFMNLETKMRHIYNLYEYLDINES